MQAYRWAPQKGRHSCSAALGTIFEELCGHFWSLSLTRHQGDPKGLARAFGFICVVWKISGGSSQAVPIYPKHPRSGNEFALWRNSSFTCPVSCALTPAPHLGFDEEAPSLAEG